MKRKLVIIGCILFSIPILLVLILLVINSILHLQNRGFIEGERDGVITKSGMVVTAHPLASQIGVDILKQGGNAFDAAIAVQFALSVVYPKAGNIGGGGFLVYRTSDGTIGSLDFRERAPLKSYRNMFLDEKGNAIKDLSRHGHLSAGVPGTVDGMARLHEKLGSLPFKELVQPSVDLAANGYLLTQKNADNMNNYRELFVKTNRFIPHFVGQKAWKKGERFIQKDLSRTLSMIRDQGRDGFYKGDTALRIIQEMEAGKGIINAEDLDAYRSIWRKPVTADYKNFRIISMPLPSSGGISLIQLLKGARKFNFKVLGHNTHQSIHLMTELERRVFADRATYLGDSDFVKVPVSNLISEDYLQTRFADINPDQKTVSQLIKPGNVSMMESLETTHYSIIDRWGNAAAVTTTLNDSFGSKVIVKGAGFLLNDEMDDFSVKPGVPNMYGMVGGEANAIEPGKRMLSSMTPTLLEKEGKLFMIVGTPGGSTIITTVFQMVLNVTEHGMNIRQAVNAGRVHSQWLPDIILFESGAIGSLNLIKLILKGHLPVPIQVVESSIGCVEAVRIMSDGAYVGAADNLRCGDDSAIGY